MSDLQVLDQVFHLVMNQISFVMPPWGFGLRGGDPIIRIRPKAKPIERWGRKATGLR